MLKLAKQYKLSPFLVLVECLCLADLVKYVSLFLPKLKGFFQKKKKKPLRKYYIMSTTAVAVMVVVVF